MLKLLRLIFILSSFLIFIGCVFGFSAGAFLYFWGLQPERNYTLSTNEEFAPFNLERGISLNKLSDELENKGMISSSLFFRYWVKGFSNFRKFQAGSYRFNPPITPLEIANTFISGETFTEPLFEVTIPEGFTLRQVIQRFLDNGIGVESEFYRLSVSPSFLKKLSISAVSIEGYLYPATYRFYETPTEEKVFSEMVSAFWKKLPSGYENHVASRGINLNQAVNIASLIEAETPHDEERSKVSEVVWLRLINGMPLGIDASVIYGVKDFDGNLRKKHLTDRSNPYNLRIYTGLPPTPLCSPSIDSLLAVLSPTQEGLLYYVVDPDRGTKHTFTKNLEAHNREVKKLVEAERLRARK